MDAVTRRAINEEAVERFFASWDPAWRWILILGLRQMRADPSTLGSLASAEANNNEGWAEDTYAYGPLSLGITAAAINEAAQHCEDLFALLKFLREPSFFARQMADYSAGKVMEFGRKLVDADDAAISRLFLVPDQALVEAGLAEAADPKSAVSAIEQGRTRLAEMLRETAEFYRKYEKFHVHYKHGLKLPLRPFGIPSDEAISERKTDVRSPLIAYTTEPLRSGDGDQVVMFTAGPHQQAHLQELVAERNLLRLNLIADVDLDEVVRRSHCVLRLLQLAQANRLALGKLEDGNQRFSLPGEQRWEQMDVTIRLHRLLSVSDFAESRTSGRRTQRGSRRARRGS
jgi:hypothetical protein